ncbi:MAG TPA: hypothetical protein VMY35_08070 [Phycisphaerae bacterium]|nr:hypothetical protein [Phycisphaerae bacterium]
MSVVSVAESWSGITWSGDYNERQTVRAFTVETSTPGRGVFSFPLTSGGVTIPAQGTPHPDAAEFISGVPQITARGPTYFEIRIPYVATGIAGAEPNPNLTPLDQAAEISWDDDDREVAYDVDLDGNVVSNAWDQPFDPPLTRSVSDPILVIERNEAAFDPDTKLDYQDTICAEDFWGAPAGRARMGKIRARSVNAATPYWRVAYRIAFRMNTPAGVADADAWKRAVLDKGTIYKGDGDDKTLHATPNGEQVLLDADGRATDAANPHWIYFTEFKTKGWSPLGIDRNEI